MIQSIVQFFKNLFSFFSQQQQKIDEQPASSINEKRISYSAQLIPALKNDHQELVALYSKISDLLHTQHYVEIEHILSSLKIEFNRHIMQENVSFYCYLEQQFADDANHMETIRSYRKEMNGISHAFIKFIKKWQSDAVTAENAQVFREEYDAIGAVLAQRINSEEDHLYPLYHPS